VRTIRRLKKPWQGTPTWFKVDAAQASLVIVVDDALPLAVLVGQPVARVDAVAAAASQGEVFTTGSWYWRLARALTRPSGGALSRGLAAMSDQDRGRAETAMGELPAEIGLLSLRRLVPVMRALPGQLNLLTAEAVSAAVVLGGAIVVSTESPLLSRAAATAGVTVEVISLG
jgi:hypothetical protein